MEEYRENLMKLCASIDMTIVKRLRPDKVRFSTTRSIAYSTMGMGM